MAKPCLQMLAFDRSFFFLRSHQIIPLAFHSSLKCMQDKAQGQTLQAVGLLLPRPVFAHGQFYVAISRVGAFPKIMVMVQDAENQGHYVHSKGLIRKFHFFARG